MKSAARLVMSVGHQVNAGITSESCGIKYKVLSAYSNTFAHPNMEWFVTKGNNWLATAGCKYKEIKATILIYHLLLIFSV